MTRLTEVGSPKPTSSTAGRFSGFSLDVLRHCPTLSGGQSTKPLAKLIRPSPPCAGRWLLINATSAGVLGNTNGSCSGGSGEDLDDTGAPLLTGRVSQVTVNSSQ